MKRKVKYPAGVRPVSNATPYTGKGARVDSGAREAAITPDQDTIQCGASCQILRIPEIGPSLNEYGRMHYQKKKLVDKWNLLVKICANEQGIRVVENYPVQIVVECYFGNGKRRFDWDNLSPTPKLIQDALVHVGILKNDSAPWIESGAMRALKTEGKSYTLFKINELRQAA